MLAVWKEGYWAASKANKTAEKKAASMAVLKADMKAVVKVG